MFLLLLKLRARTYIDYITNNNMNIQQRKKAKFRNTSKWKKFRQLLAAKHNNIDIVTMKKLYKGYNCHHKDLNEDHYEQLIEDNFICLNKNTHEFIHWLYNYYKDDETILYRIKKLLDEMKALNNC